MIERKVEAALGKKKDYQSICRMDSNPKVRKIMEEMLMDLSSAVISLENIMNFEIILLGLGAIYWPERYLTEVFQQKSENPCQKDKFPGQSYGAGGSVQRHKQNV